MLADVGVLQGACRDVSFCDKSRGDLGNRLKVATGTRHYHDTLLVVRGNCDE